MSQSSLLSLESRVHACGSCSRLRAHCAKVANEKRRAYAEETYWGKPIAGFGDPQAELLVIGLAPGAHGANRTGRVFTGDRSGEWLYRALHRAGFANQPESTHSEDELRLKGAYVTCVVKCAPPGNKPERSEIARCGKQFLEEELHHFSKARVYLALGQIALQGLWPWIGQENPRPRFTHGAEIRLSNGKHLLLSYHPSQQNTFTGRLTEPMFDRIFARTRKIIEAAH